MPLLRILLISLLSATPLLGMLNRLQTLGVTDNAAQILQGYGYTLNNAGHRTTITESNGRVSNYTYDTTYKLLSETISGTTNINGASTYTYDQVGNRLTQTTNVAGLSNQTFNYTDNDWLGGDTMDNNGNTVTSPLTVNGTDLYDFEDKLIRRTKQDGTVIDLLYNTDGDRVQKTVDEPSQPTITDTYHVDANNHTGYPQVVEEFTTTSGSPLATSIFYTYGHDLIAQTDNGTTTYYTYDGLGTVRGLTDTAGTLTDTFDYDAWGNLIARTGTTPNLYLFTGEQYDPDLGMYYLRARYMNPGTGRFWNADTFEGSQSRPLTLHKYLYVHSDPVNLLDPSGLTPLAEAVAKINIQATLRLGRPVISGKNTFKRIRSVQKVICKLSSKGARAAHHIIPIFMRGINLTRRAGSVTHLSQGVVIRIGTPQHQAYHSILNAVLKHNGVASAFARKPSFKQQTFAGSITRQQAFKALAQSARVQDIFCKGTKGYTPLLPFVRRNIKRGFYDPLFQ